MSPSHSAAEPAIDPAISDGVDAATLAAITAADGRSVLIHGGIILSQDSAVGDFKVGDVLIRAGKITDVGADLGQKAGDAIMVDASGMIVTPGFVESHVHAWEGQLRGAAPGLDLEAYFGFTAFGYGPHYRPHDNYIGTLTTALVALDAGITTIIDNSHNSRTPDHSAAAVEALLDAGIRGVHAAGAPIGIELKGWPRTVTQLRDQYFTSSDALVSLRLFEAYPSEQLWDFARDEDLWISHEMGGHIDNVSGVLAELDSRGLLTEKHAFNHCYGLSDETWKLIAGRGVAVNVCPRSDAAYGLGTGLPPIDQARAAGVVPGLSGDNEIGYGLSMFTEMATLLNKHRASVFAASHDVAHPQPAHLDPADVLRFATVGGAANAGLLPRIGSITPGKDADIILIRTTDLNTTPATNAVATVTAFAHAGNVDTVLVAGVPRKWRGTLVDVDLDRVRDQTTASRDYLFAARGQLPDPLAPTGATSPA